MNEQINAELAKLQDELSALDSAVKHIEKAGQISTEVINAIKTIEIKYAEHLDQILNQYSEYLNNSYRHVEGNINELLISHKAQVDEITKSMTSVLKNHEESDKLNKELFVTSQASFEKRSDELSTALSSQINDVNKILGSYLELAQATAKLYEKIEQVDFPARFDKVEVILSNTYQEINSIKANMKAITDANDVYLQKMKSMNSKQNFMIFVIILFMLLSFGLAYVLKYYPSLLR